MRIEPDYSASAEDCLRPAILPDLCVDTTDPRNARDLAPLANPADEDTARTMADVTFGAACDDLDDAVTAALADALYDQCLIDARRMQMDERYAQLIGDAGTPAFWRHISA
jgi:hypothetical protein